MEKDLRLVMGPYMELRMSLRTWFWEGAKDGDSSGSRTGHGVGHRNLFLL